MIRHCSFALVAGFFMMGAILSPGQTVSQYTKSDSAEARIEVVASQPASFKIPRTIYGTFLENIGFSMYGGLSAQLLDNPSLETYYASLEFLERRFLTPPFRRSTHMGLPLPWLPLHEKDGWRYEPRWGEAANSYAYLYLIGLDGREVGLRQTIHMPVHRELNYEGSLFASSEEGSVELDVSLRRPDSAGDVLASARVTVPAGGRWSKLPFQLSLKEGTVAPLEAADFVVALRGGQRVSLDFIRLYPADAVRGMDPDVIRLSKALRTPLVRYGGNFTSGYHWRDGVGPLDLRPTKLNQAWGYPEYNDIGTDEILAYCELIGAQAQFCLNLGSGTPEEARAWIEYLQGPLITPEGKRRADNGHPQPYQVAAYEFGNELWGDFQIGWQTPEGNLKRYHDYYTATRSAIPKETMVIATGADPDNYGNWNGALLNAYPDELHYLSTHFVVGMGDIVKPHADRNFTYAAGLALPVAVGRALESMKAQIDAHPRTRDRVKIAFTEYLFWARENSEDIRFTNLGGAINGAAWMNMLLARADSVPIANMTGIIDFAGIQKKRSKVFLTPQAWAFSLYSNYAGDTPIATRTAVGHYDIHQGQKRFPEIAGVPYLDVLATRDSHTGELTVFVVNRDFENAISATVALADFAAAPEVVAHTLTGGSLMDHNDEENPEKVRPVRSTLKAEGGRLRHTFPPASVTALIFRAR
jgi:alpha-N-arabinofuranosidase